MGKSETAINANLDRTLAQPSLEKYIASMDALTKKYGTEAVLTEARALRDTCVADLTAMGIEPSEYAKSMSWAMWDLAKQFHMNNHPIDTSARYNGALADPLEVSRRGKQKRAEIISRHIGWESVGKRDKLAGLSPEAEDILAKLDKAGVDQLSSYDLARLGEELARAFRITGQGYSGPELVEKPVPVPTKATKGIPPRKIVAMRMKRARGALAWFWANFGR